MNRTPSWHIGFKRPLSASVFDVGLVNHVPRKALGAEHPFLLRRIVDHVCVMAVTDYNAPQNIGAGISEPMRQAAFAVAQKVTLGDRKHLIPDLRSPLPRQNIDAFILSKMDVRLSCIAARLHLHYVKPETGQADEITQGFVHALRIGVQEVSFRGTL
jgi:hypothetical protein